MKGSLSHSPSHGRRVAGRLYAASGSRSSSELPSAYPRPWFGTDHTSSNNIYKTQPHHNHHPHHAKARTQRAYRSSPFLRYGTAHHPLSTSPIRDHSRHPIPLPPLLPPASLLPRITIRSATTAHSIYTHAVRIASPKPLSIGVKMFLQRPTYRSLQHNTRHASHAAAREGSTLATPLALAATFASWAFDFSDMRALRRWVGLLGLLL